MFTYSDYLDILNIGVQKKNVLFVRHDVDISLKKALQMAEFESRNGIHATYYILLTSPFYNALTPENLERIRMIAELGHGIGLHYDITVKEKMQDQDIANEIMMQMGLLIHHIGEITNSVTFHKPFTGKMGSVQLINILNKMDITCPSFDNKYKYISDSGHNWREDPVEVMLKYDHIHINIHPEWYNEEYKDFVECLNDLRLDVETDKVVQKEIKHIYEYLVKVKEK
jgi:hypothetical protein